MNTDSCFIDFEKLTTDAVMPSLHAMESGSPILSAEERRAEWLKQRWGKFTASEFHRLMGYEDKPELSNGGKTYARQKAVERMTECKPEVYISPAMQWGIDHEHAAIDAFMRATGLEVTDCKDGQNFIELSGDVGGTPDGIIEAMNAGIEVKCPTSLVHLDYMETIRDAMSLKQSAPEYYWQIQGLMMITGLESWFFVSYDPRYIDENLRLHIASIEQVPEDIAKLENRLDLAIDYCHQVMKQKLGLDPQLGVHLSISRCLKSHTSIKLSLELLTNRIKILEQSLASIGPINQPSSRDHSKHYEWFEKIQQCNTLSDISRLLKDIPKTRARR